jgi:hypothetical protein
MDTLPGAVKHYFNKFEDALLIVSRIQNIYILQDMLIDVLYTISSELNQ